MVTDAKVAIAGGSLGGLTAGLLLRDLGLDVTIYERSSERLESRGAGIGFLPDASRYLVERAGVSLDSVSTSVDLIRYLHRDGSVAHEREHTYHFSSWNTVYRHLRELFPDDRYLLGHEVLSHEQDDDSVRMHLGTGDTVHADLFVCADGVSSRFRDHFLPDAHRAYAGYVAWRGMVPESELPEEVAAALGEVITYYLYANSQILVYPIPGADGSLVKGERLINYVWYRNYKLGDDLADLMTDTYGVVQDTSLPPGHVRDVHVREMRAHAEARLPHAISTVIQATAQPFLQVVYDLAITRMAFGRVCLIGDAAVVMRPHAAAGTAKAAANAWALAQALTDHDTVPEALEAWEPGEVAMGYQLAQRTQRLGFRSQVLSDWDAPEDDTLFRLRDEGP